MNQSPSLARRLASSLVLLSGIGGGGYYYLGPGTSSDSAPPAQDGALDAVLASWEHSETSSVAPSAAASSAVAPAGGSEEGAATPPVVAEPLPMGPPPYASAATDDRYASAVDTLAGRYGAPKSNPTNRRAAKLAQERAAAANELPAQAHAGPAVAAVADESIARGQTPDWDPSLPATLPEGNPLREAEAPVPPLPSPPASLSVNPPKGLSAGAENADAVRAFATSPAGSPMEGVVPAAAESPSRYGPVLEPPLAGPDMVEPAADLPPSQEGGPQMNGPRYDAGGEPVEPPTMPEPMAEAPAPLGPDGKRSVLQARNELRAPAAQPMAPAYVATQQPLVPPYSANAPLDGTPPFGAAPLGAPMSDEPGVGAEPRGLGVEGSGRPGERTLEGRQLPSLAIQKFAPPEVQVGSPCKFQVKVRNVGQRVAHDVVVRDAVPAGTQFVGATPSAEVSGSELLWSLGDISPGEERTLEVELTPQEEGEVGSVASVSFRAEASARTVSTKPQLALRLTAPARVMLGQEQRIQIEIHNPGTGVANNVMILEQVPEHLRHEAGPSLEFEVGALKPGETRRMQLLMTAESPGHVVNALTARADGDLAVEQRVEFDIVAPALEVGLEGPSKRYLERPVTFTVSVGNPGTAAARDVRIVTRLPRALKFLKANNLGEYDAATHAVYWSLAELPEGEHGSVELTALPVAPGDHTVSVEGKAQSGLRDEATQLVRIEGIAAINFSVTDLQDPIEVGGHTEYEVRVTNQGTKAATNVVVRAVAPPGMQLVSAQAEARHQIQGGELEFAPLARLAPQGVALYKVRVLGAQAGDQRVTVEVTSDDLAQPVRKEESTRVYGDE